MGNVTLALGGMTCASCASRIEKRLNRIDGVHATVNFATEQASIDFRDDVTRDELVAAVEATGYTATLPAVARSAEEPWLPRLLVSAALSAPVKCSADTIDSTSTGALSAADTSSRGSQDSSAGRAAAGSVAV